MSDTIAMVVAIPTSLLAALVLVGIGLLITGKPSPQLVRRHSGPDTYWSIQPEQISHSEGVLTAEYKPRRYRDDNTVDEDDSTIILDGTIETWESYGRRGADSPVRHLPVPSDWMPPLGNVRIAILETPTAEYLFARKPKDQLTTRIVRGYMTNGLVQSW